MCVEQTPRGCILSTSARVTLFHLQEIVEDEALNPVLLQLVLEARARKGQPF